MVTVSAVASLWSGAAASGEVVADWRMNEGAGAAVMADSAGRAQDGGIGDDVGTGVRLPGGGAGYSFPGPEWGHDPARVVRVRDHRSLDPGRSTYAVTVRLRTTQANPNIVQKGQSGQRGGFWKLVLNEGWPRCHFRDESGRTRAVGFVGGSADLKVDDGQWHVLRCERQRNGVRVTLDGTASRRIAGSLGVIDSRRPLMVGGKIDCAAADVGCDYYRGLLDYVLIEKG